MPIRVSSIRDRSRRSESLGSSKRRAGFREPVRSGEPQERSLERVRRHDHSARVRNGAVDRLPESKSAVASDKSEDPAVLSISENEDIFLDAKKMTLEELTSAVEKLVREKGRPALAMKADKKVSYGFLIKVLDALKDAGIKGNLSAFTDAKP